MKMDPNTNNRLHINGALGTGKSHLLAALACALWKSGKTVVYLPDSYHLLLREPPCMYVVGALQLAFAHQDAYLSNKIMALSASAERLEKEVLAFCAEVSELGMCIIFIIDQTNALDDAVEDRIPNDKKGQVRRFLDGISSNHIKISSSTANYLAAKHDNLRQTGEARIDIFDGLDVVCHSLPALAENIC